MTAKDILAFQFGRADAIRAVASSSSAIWTGIVLVLLTAFARNYDQTYIPEKPFLWFFGPLLFSFFSGSWLYLVCYTGCARRLMKADDAEPSSDTAWRGFMGAFWMTAPIAWLYAIPVERFFDSLTAAKANIALLAIVSLWRVLLMARVFQVVTRVPYARTLLWVILATSVEVVLLFFASGAVMKRVMASMSGLRNSPEEEVLLSAMSLAGNQAIVVIPIVGVLLLAWRWIGSADKWPEIHRKSLPLRALIAVAACWIAATIPSQIELRRNSAVEQFVSRGEMRAAIDFLKRHQPKEFAPVRPLPPKLFEATLIKEAFGLAGVLREDDPTWVRQHIAKGLTRVSEQLREAWHPGKSEGNTSPEDLERVIVIFGILPRDVLPMLRNPNLAPEVSQWLENNPNFLFALLSVAQSPPEFGSVPDYPVSKQGEDWKLVAHELTRLGITGSENRKGLSAP
jgi:hypothetical protein